MSFKYPDPRCLDDQCLARPLLTHQHTGEGGVSLLKTAFVIAVSQLSCSFRLWMKDNIKLTDDAQMYCAICKYLDNDSFSAVFSLPQQ